MKRDSVFNLGGSLKNIWTLYKNKKIKINFKKLKKNLEDVNLLFLSVHSKKG